MVQYLPFDGTMKYLLEHLKVRLLVALSQAFEVGFYSAPKRRIRDENKDQKASVSKGNKR